MKYLSLVFLALFASCYSTRPGGYGDAKSLVNCQQPFQILYAENVYYANGHPAARMELPDLTDSLELEPGSMLILVHHTGHFMEFSGDTILVVDQLANELAQRFSIEKGKMEYRPNIVRLLTDRKADLNTTGGIVCRPTADIAWKNPFVVSTTISENTAQVCLAWTSQSEDLIKGYLIRIVNIFDEPVDLIEVDQSQYMLDFSKYSEAEGLFIISVEAKDDPDWRSMHIGIRLGEEYQKQLDLCNIKTAVRALEAAWMYENNLAILEAGKYYELASQLSEYKVYSEIYELFLKKYP